MNNGISQSYGIFELEDNPESKQIGKSKRAEDIMDEAACTLKERAALRDAENGERAMKICVDMFSAAALEEILETGKISEKMGYLFMICLKISRSRQGKYHADDYVDILGYAALLAEAADDEATSI